jgi:hypothetical protein
VLLVIFQRYKMVMSSLLHKAGVKGDSQFVLGPLPIVMYVLDMKKHYLAVAASFMPAVI